MVFSNKSCEESKSPDDFDKKYTFDLDENGEGEIVRRPIDIKGKRFVFVFKCGKKDEVYGIME